MALNTAKPQIPSAGKASFEYPIANCAVLVFSGTWTMQSSRPKITELFAELNKAKNIQELSLQASELDAFDSTFTSFLFDLIKTCQSKSIKVVTDKLPEGTRKLLALGLAVPERKGARRDQITLPLLDRIGVVAANLGSGITLSLDFIGETTFAFGRFLIGKAILPRGQLGLIIQDSGPSALPIVTLISMLVGLILAFIGAIQLEQFGAQIYVANLVGIAMAREMGAIMAGIIMAGRTGAAFAAQLGTMQVNEEIDALKTLAIQPTEFLVLPRILALVAVMPLLCLYAIFMGSVGGFIVAVTTLNISATQYINQTIGALTMTDIWVGVVKSIVFGILVAGTGCMRGMQCGRSASAVGHAVTSAVVSGIVCIVVTDAIFSILTNILGI